jgi:hypothetical protein
MSEQQFEELKQMMKKNPEQYILKPNLEGGGNNYFGK